MLYEPRKRGGEERQGWKHCSPSVCVFSPAASKREKKLRVRVILVCVTLSVRVGAHVRSASPFVGGGVTGERKEKKGQFDPSGPSDTVERERHSSKSGGWRAILKKKVCLYLG